jgi:tetratricopeptide (TPR) repeat protein
VDITDRDEAANWFTEERHVLLGILRLAVDAGLDTRTWQLARTLQIFFDRRGYWDDLHAAATTALPAASRSADRSQLAAAHRRLSWVCIQLGRFGDASTHLRHALDIAGELGDRSAQSKAQFLLAVMFDRQDDYGEALRNAETALDNFRAAGNTTRIPVALNMVGWCRALLGDYEQTLESCRQALALHQENGDRYGQAAAWDSLGYAHQHLGHTQAGTCYLHAIELFRETGDRYSEADTLGRLGDTHHAAHDPDAAREAWLQALAIFDDLDHSDAEPIRAKLDALANDPQSEACPDDVRPPRQTELSGSL